MKCFNNKKNIEKLLIVLKKSSEVSILTIQSLVMLVS